MFDSDPLELLLPDAAPALRARARELVVLSRLLAESARGPRAGSTATTPQQVRTELERVSRATLGAAARALLALHLELSSVVPGEGNAERSAERAHQEAWSVLEDERRDGGDVPEVPAPGEPRLAVAERVLSFCRARGLLDGQAEELLWQARHAWAARGARAAEEGYAALLASDAAVSWKRRAVGELVRAQLERGAVGLASTTLERSKPLVQDDSTLRRLLGGVALLLGDLERAKGLLGEGIPVEPASWAEFVRAESPPAIRRGPGPIRARADAGAVLLAVFAVGEGGVARPVHLDVAAGLTDRATPWVERRAGVGRVRGEPEHEVLTAARRAVRHRRGSQPLRGALGADSRAVVLEPVLDNEGEAAGWIRLELEHHDVPPVARLEATARHWAARVLEERGSRGEPVVVPHPGPRGHSESDDARVRVVGDWIERLGRKMNCRRWWFFVACEGALLPIVEGGKALEDWRDAEGGGRAVRRAFATAGSVAFQETAPELALHGGAGSGFAIALCSGAEVLGVFALESARRGDLGREEAERWLEDAEELVPALRVAQFSAWHTEAFGYPVHLEPRSAIEGEPEVSAGALRSSAPATITGPPGAGKTCLARWLHFEAGAVGPFDVYRCGIHGLEATRERLFGGALRRGKGLLEEGAGTLVLRAVDRLPEELQVQLLEALETRGLGESPDRRWLATVDGSLADAVQKGRLRRELARILERIELQVRPLRRRRAEIPGLAELFLRRFAALEDIDPPLLSDAAMAFLWRQPWEDNVRGLETLCCRLTLQLPGQTLDAEGVATVARRLGHPAVARLASRRPAPEDLEAALEITRKKTGAWNKRRAAEYLGWDPDTLVARLRDLEGAPTLYPKTDSA